MDLTIVCGEQRLTPQGTTPILYQRGPDTLLELMALYFGVAVREQKLYIGNGTEEVREHVFYEQTAFPAGRIFVRPLGPDWKDLKEDPRVLLAGRHYRVERNGR